MELDTAALVSMVISGVATPDKADLIRRVRTFDTLARSVLRSRVPLTRISKCSLLHFHLVARITCEQSQLYTRRVYF
jgi:hypothetical protein